ncbi:MAG: hypothetical protein FWF15_03250, partial [Oscillospiraceae bacterium]|nr:hypothetical protein [Oscillospiraceae bacterium]
MKKISIMLLFALLIGLFISCGGNEAKSDIPNGTNNDETETEAKKVIDIEYIDLGGYEIRFIVRGEGSGNFQCIDLYSESMNGDKINDAVYERNSYLEEMYNFKIKMTGVAVNVASIVDSPATVAKTSILSQEDLFDVVYDSFHQTNSLLQEKMLVDLYTLPYINFSKPYWDADVNADLSINNKLYTTHGEHMLSVSAGLYCTFFNKEMAEDLNLENLYDVVRNNK